MLILKLCGVILFPKISVVEFPILSSNNGKEGDDQAE